MRLNKPTGIWLLMWPCWWSVVMASPGAIPDVRLLSLFAFGAIVMRSAGCIINDIIDREIDRKVERTKMRPIASGALSVRDAQWVLAALLAFGAVILLSLPWVAIALSVVSIIPVVIYPYMKRIFAWPQLFLGLTFNMGALIGWAAIGNNVSYAALSLYGACIFWTLGYDTIYGHQDKKSDAQIGIKSTALSWGKYTKILVSLSYLIMVLLLLLAAILSDTGGFFLYGLLPVALHLGWQIWRVKLDNPESCMRIFRSNTWLGWLVFIALVAEKMRVGGF